MSIIEKAAKRLGKKKTGGSEPAPQSPELSNEEGLYAEPTAELPESDQPTMVDGRAEGGYPAEQPVDDIGMDAPPQQHSGLSSTPASGAEHREDDVFSLDDSFDALVEPSEPTRHSTIEQAAGAGRPKPGEEALPQEAFSPFQDDPPRTSQDAADRPDSKNQSGQTEYDDSATPTVEADMPDSPFADSPSPPSSGVNTGRNRSSIAAAYSDEEAESPFHDATPGLDPMPTLETGGAGQPPRREEPRSDFGFGNGDLSGELSGPSLEGFADSDLVGEDEDWHFDDVETGEERLIPLTKLSPGLLLSPEGGRTRTAEEFRIIKRPLLVKAFDRKDQGDQHHNLIMVTSAVQSEGKTFISLNLAISIAMEMDSTVLLVDADVAKPGLSRVLKVPQRPGLIEQLTDEHEDLSDLLMRTDIPKLTVLPAGERHKRSTELLASLRMREFLDEVASRYSDRIVLFDSPPLLESTEATVLASQMGQVVMVVESESTPQMVVKEALSQLESQDNVSLVLNKCKESVFSNLLSGKYSGYGYGYGYGAEPDSGSG